MITIGAIREIKNKYVQQFFLPTTLFLFLNTRAKTPVNKRDGTPAITKVLNNLILSVKITDCKTKLKGLISNGKYKLHYDNLLLDGVFSKIMFLIIETQSDPSIFFKKDSDIAELYGMGIQTVQMFKAYLRTGWGKEIDQK